MFERAWKICGRIAAVGAILGLVACGSGGVTDTSATSGPIAVVPATATMYSGVPTTFFVSGGSGSFTVVSSDQTVIPNASGLSGSSFSVVANAVAADTPVTLTVRDAAGTSQALTITVKPRTVSSTITITPTSSQSAACGTSICSGGDAEVAATLSQAGAPLVGRQVLFEAISGDFRFITSPVGAPETLSTSVTTSTDTTGAARVRIRVLPNATPQTALLQITDVVSGAFQRTSFTIALASASGLSAQPAAILFTGLTPSSCSSGISADVIVTGGLPPYSITNPGAFVVSPQVLGTSGSRFTVTSTGQCSAGSPIAVVDAQGASVTVTASNNPGTITVSPLVVGPESVSLSQSCGSVASVLIAGGTGAYFAASGDGAIGVTMLTNMASIHWITGVKPASTAIKVAISDGRTVATVTVNVPASTLTTGCI
jgi:hypothetical protein